MPEEDSKIGIVPSNESLSAERDASHEVTAVAGEFEKGSPRYEDYLVENNIVGSVSPEHAERIPSDLFPGLSPERAEQARMQALSGISDTVSHTSDDVLRKTAERWRKINVEDVPTDEVEDGDLPGDVLEAYGQLRGNGFSDEEVTTLFESARDGSLNTLLAHKLQEECGVGKRWLEAAKSRIEQQDEALRLYFSTRGIPFPTRQQPSTVPIGKYGSLVVASAEDGRLGVMSAMGRFLEEANAIYVRTDELPLDTETGEPDDNTMYVMGHERLHSLSVVRVPEFAGDSVLQNEKMPGYQVGFTRRMSAEGGMEYGNLNEAVTEYFARDFAETVQYQRERSMYDEEVESLDLLLEHLSQMGSREQAERQLLQRYTEISGLESFEQELHDKVGPQGLVVCDMLLTRPHLLKPFLEGVRAMSDGGEPTPIEISLDTLESAKPAPNIPELLTAYPFIQVYMHVRDPDTGEWRKEAYNPSIAKAQQEHGGVSVDTETTPSNKVETGEAIRNANSIGELLSVGRDVPVEEGMVYRSVMGDGAISDLFTARVVRNAFAAGVNPHNRWGDRVFWSAGKEGQFHGVQEGGYVIVAPEAEARAGEIGVDKVKHIFTKENGRVIDLMSDEGKKVLDKILSNTVSR